MKARLGRLPIPGRQRLPRGPRTAGTGYRFGMRGTKRLLQGDAALCRLGEMVNPWDQSLSYGACPSP